MKRLPNPARPPARWVTPEPLNVAPSLVGLPLAPSVRRAAAIGLDLAVVALLSGVSGLWLLGGLALVLLQLRSQRGGTQLKARLVVGWVGAGLVVLLAFQEAHTQWDEWRRPGTAVAEDAEEAAAPQAAKPPASAASLPAAARITQLEAELAQARAAKPRKLRDQLSGFLDDIGAGLGWGIVYFSLLPAWWGGQTVGKKLFGLQVMELTGKPMTVMRSLKRYGGYAAGVATGGLGLAQVLWDPNRQGLHDKAAHTVVIDLRAPRRAEPVLEGPAPAPPPDQNA
jgi:hypothetical protein